MKAICVDEKRDLQLRDVSAPPAPAAGYVNVRISAAAINHGDRTFLKFPDAAGGVRGSRLQSIWGSSAAGIVTEIGDGVPPHYRGRKVAIYRSLQPDKPFLGTWCEIAQLPYLACLPLPEDVDEKNYSGSLVNIVTAYAFIEQATAEGHRGIFVTAGSSATGRALAALAQRRGLATISIVRNSRSRAELMRAGVGNVLASDAADFIHVLEGMARDFSTTAVFDGVGGTLVSRLLVALPVRSSISFYGFLSGAENVVFGSSIFMMKDLTMKRFSNFDSALVRDEKRLEKMLADLSAQIRDQRFHTPIGQTFELKDYEAAMGCNHNDGRKAVLLPQS